jgi:hypothetical protein
MPKFVAKKIAYPPEGFADFWAFYPFYLGEHMEPTVCIPPAPAVVILFLSD